MLVPSARLLRILSSPVPFISAGTCPSCFRYASNLQSLLQIPQDSQGRLPEIDITKPETLRTPEARHLGRVHGELVPKPLARPFGLEDPPQAGQNSGRFKSWKEAKSYYTDPVEKVKRQRKIIWEVWHNNWAKDLTNVGKIHKGKSILAPITPFKSHLALYFPNLQGMTLEKSKPITDTTPAFKDRITILGVEACEWGSQQINTFVSKESNPQLHKLMEEYEPAKGLAQFAHIQNEENYLKAWLIQRVIRSRIKKNYPVEQHARHWLNRRGLTPEMRDALGMWNSKVGYVYLLDGACRIRWAGNGEAREDEKKSLVSCVKRLIDEARGLKKPSIKVRREEPRSIGSRSSESGQDRTKTAAVS